MKIVKTFKQGLMTRVFEEPGGNHLVITAIHYFNLTGEAPRLNSDIDMWKMISKEFGHDVMLDMAMAKLNGEVLVTGKFFAPGGKPVPAGNVKFTLGNVSRELYVFGSRRWKILRRISDPEPIAELPISYANAYGGEGYAKNPLGVGFKKILNKEGKSIRPLPHVEDPKHLIASPKDKPEPASFGPIDITWPQRMSKAGTYDMNWMKERFPCYAKDMDWSIFNAAHPDQWNKGYFEGNENYELINMHPEKPAISGKLPGYRARAFITRKESRSENFIEVENMRLDTVWFIPHVEAGLMFWRGTIKVEDDEASDVDGVMIAGESLVSPKSVDHYHEAYSRRCDPDRAIKYFFDETDLLPNSERPFMADVDEMIKKSRPSELVKNVNTLSEDKKQEAKSILEEKAPDYADNEPSDPSQAQEFPTTVAGMLDYSIEKILEEKKKEAEKKVAEAEAKLREKMTAAGLDYDKLKAEREKQAVPRFRISVPLLMRSIHKAREIIPDFDKYMAKQGVDPARIEEKIQETVNNFLNGYRMSAHFMKPGPRLTPDKTGAVRRAFLTEFASGKSFRQSDYAGMDFSGLDLTGIDFREALLEDCNFSGTNLTGADLSMAIVVASDFTGAKCMSANFSGCNLGASDLSSADFSNSNLQKAVLSRCNLDRSIFSGADLKQTNLLEIKIRNSNFENAKLNEVMFIELDAPGCSFKGVDFTSGICIKTKFPGADFSGSTLEKLCMITCEVPGGNFDDSRMDHFCTVANSSLPSASFRRSQMNKCAMQEANLKGTDFSNAAINNGSFMKSDFTGANLSGVKAQGALFMKADMREANVSGSDLMYASLMKANLALANFTESNLFGAEFLRAIYGKTIFKNANLKKTKLEKWAPPKNE